MINLYFPVVFLVIGLPNAQYMYLLISSKFWIWKQGNRNKIIFLVDHNLADVYKSNMYCPSNVGGNFKPIKNNCQIQTFLLDGNSGKGS